MECRESNSGLLGEKQVCYLCAIQLPPLNLVPLQDVYFAYVSANTGSAVVACLVNLDLMQSLVSYGLNVISSF